VKQKQNILLNDVLNSISEYFSLFLIHVGQVNNLKLASFMLFFLIIYMNFSYIKYNNPIPIKNICEFIIG